MKVDLFLEPIAIDRVVLRHAQLFPRLGVGWRAALADLFFKTIVE